MEQTHHLRAWRKFRHLTLEEVADAVGSTKATIQQLETGRISLSHKWLVKLAPVLGTTPGFLLDHDPNNLDTAYLEAALSVPKGSRAQALDILKTFGRTGTGG
jgi:transcriptional regulator with XRE-family HTH domain